MIWSTGGYVTFWCGEVHIGHRELDHDQYKQPMKRGFISGACMLVPSQVLWECGLLPEAYFFGKEEWEFSMTVHRAGYELWYDPDFSICHEASNSHRWTDPMYVYNGALSKALYKRRNMSGLSYFVWSYAYLTYLRLFFDLRFRILRTKYVQGIPPAVIREAEIQGLLDAADCTKVTESMLSALESKIETRNSG